MPLIYYRTGDYAKLTAEPDQKLKGIEMERVSGCDCEFIIKTGSSIFLAALMRDRVFGVTTFFCLLGND
jgi:phenylacetate-coenzyme A ligase PaaK-like adenylate-forming protein